jgi:osmotically inducible lipoprotein OsmB
MNKPLRSSRPTALIAALLLAAAATGCSNMSQRDKNTAVGAGVGAAAGAILTGGGTLGTLGGAAVGGVIGNQVNTKK